VGDEGNLILYSAMTSEDKLDLQFQYFARDDSEGDCEFNHTVEPEEFTNISEIFGLDPAAPIIENLKQISATGRGQELRDLIAHQKFQMNSEAGWARGFSSILLNHSDFRSLMEV
jgi:hypothetical protein